MIWYSIIGVPRVRAGLREAAAAAAQGAEQRLSHYIHTLNPHARSLTLWAQSVGARRRRDYAQMAARPKQQRHKKEKSNVERYWGDAGAGAMAGDFPSYWLHAKAGGFFKLKYANT